MRKSIIMAFSALLSLTSQAQTVATMQDLNPEQKSMALSLKLTGQLTVTGNSDYRQLRDLCFQLHTLDLSEAQSREIPKNAFHSRHRLTTVVLPQCLESIGSQAFFACDGLREITIPSTVKRIGDAAFSGCKAVETLTIEGSPSIGDYAFARLEALQTVKVNAVSPPAATPNSFYGIDRSKVRLVVPAGAEKAYSKAEGWSLFYKDAKPEAETCDPTACLTPEPLTLKVLRSKPIKVKTSWAIEADPSLDNEAERAMEVLQNRMGMIVHSRQKGLRLKLHIDTALEDDEAYTLRVDNEGAVIAGKTPKGVFYGIMTLDQLLRGSGKNICVDALPQLAITDKPRTHVRELMVDPARIFIPFDELKAFVPEMARYKLNALHLHLVDDQSWRIEIKSYPQLTQQASSRWGQDDMLMPIEGYYTQEQMRELVAYAAKYHVDIVPEIEMPGHEVAAISVFPELTCGARRVPVRTTCGVSNQLLCPGNDFTYEFLGNVMREIADIFPSPYIHLGGDEAGNPPLDCWTDCDKCKALKRKLGIEGDSRADNWRLQAYLFDRMISLLKEKYHKTPMFWYEPDFKEIQPGCVTFAWRDGETQMAIETAVRNGARIMLCPGEHCYYDYPMDKGDMPEVNWGMPVTSLRSAYSLDPSWGNGPDFERNNLFGVAGTLWSECINSPERVYYQAYPRAIALAEVGWSAAEHRSWDSFIIRLKANLRDMMRRGITFSMELEGGK